MRRLLIALLASSILALGCPGYANPSGSCLLTVGFFNTMRFGHSGSYCKDLDQVAEILGRYDLVGLVEVMRNTGGCDSYETGDLGHLRALVARLSASTRAPWDFAASSSSLGSGSYKEYYAFIYRTDRVTCTSTPMLYPDPEDRFEREPLIADFRSGDFDFTAVAVHITWGDGATDPVREVALLDDVWDYVQDLDADQDDIILMGDFNIDTPSATPFSALQALGIDALLSGRGIRTTYSSGTSAVGVSWYDNIWVDLDHTGHEFTGISNVDYLHTRYYLDATWPHIEVRGAISDHCPVWAQFFICSGDDDPACE